MCQDANRVVLLWVFPTNILDDGRTTIPYFRTITGGHENVDILAGMRVRTPIQPDALAGLGLVLAYNQGEMVHGFTRQWWLCGA